MRWFRKNSEPVTTNNRIILENEEGKIGFISVRLVAGSARMYGVVFGIDYAFDQHGNITDEKHSVLDHSPIVDGVTIEPEVIGQTADY